MQSEGHAMLSRRKLMQSEGHAMLSRIKSMQSEGHAMLPRRKLMQSEGHATLPRIKSMQSEGHAMLPQIKSMQSEGHTTLSRRKSTQSEGHAMLPQIKSMQSEGHATLPRIKSIQSEGHAMLSRIILYRPCRTGIGQTRGLSLHAAYRPSPITFLLPIRLFFIPIRAERPHVGTDPVSVRLSANSVYRPHNIFRTCSVVWYLLCRPCRAEGGQQITPQSHPSGSIPTCGLSAEWKILLNRTHTSFNIGM